MMYIIRVLLQKRSADTKHHIRPKTAFNSSAAESDSNHMLICCSIINNGSYYQC